MSGDLAVNVITHTSLYGERHTRTVDIHLTHDGALKEVLFTAAKHIRAYNAELREQNETGCRLVINDSQREISIHHTKQGVVDVWNIDGWMVKD